MSADELDLDAIRARVEAVHMTLDALGGSADEKQYRGLVRTVAASADDVPALLAEIERLREVVAAHVRQLPPEADR